MKLHPSGYPPGRRSSASPGRPFRGAMPASPVLIPDRLGEGRVRQSQDHTFGESSISIAIAADNLEAPVQKGHGT
jgi:hypothetical protein